MSTQITTQKVLAFDSFANFPLTGLEGYIYIDNLANIGYLWDEVGIQYVNIGGVDTPVSQDPIPLTFANAATNGVLSPTPNYNNGTLGVGATLIGSTNGALTDGTSAGKIDSTYTPVVGDIILVKNQTVSANPTLNKAFQNGLYVINDVGSVSAPYQLTRVDDFDTSTELYPLQINILSGNNNALKYFIQTTVNPVIGTSNLIFSISSVQSIVSQISFVDTVIDTALSNITYANGTVIISIPGNGATLTSTVNGALGTWNGLTANTNSSVANSFTKVLVINQTNPAHNGDYQVINAGSASTPWKLVRINTTASGFNRYTRYFVVSNTGSTKAGKVYFTTPNATPLTNATIGTSPINIVEYGGSGAGGYNLIQEEGTSLPARTTIDFQGAGVTASDDGSKTIVTIPGGNTIVGENYVVVYAGDDWEANATELQNAYNLAQTLTPNGTSISATNRVTVICYPGYYDFRSTFIVDQDYIDLVSLTGECDVRLKCQTSIIAISVRSHNDVLISGIDTQFVSLIFAIEVDTTPNHIFKNCKGGEYSFGAYDNNIFTTKYDVGGTFIDCQGNSFCFGYGTSASGIFTNCVAEGGSFGGGDISLTLQGDATGTFTNCVANDNSFGVNGTCTGRFINCTANTKSFGYTCTQVTGAYFENCKGGDDCFVSSLIPNITISNITGDVINCTANDRSFGYGYATANCNLNFYECTGNDYCFVVNMKSSDTITCKCNNCTANDYSFGYGTINIYVKHDFFNCLGRNYCFSGANQGMHRNCIAGSNSFQEATTEISMGQYENCSALSNSFGSIISKGNYNNCSAGYNSFGGATGIASGNYYYCTANQDSFASDITGTLSGKLYWCQMAGTTFNTVTAPGRTFYCVGNDTPNNQ